MVEQAISSITSLVPTGNQHSDFIRLRRAITGTVLSTMSQFAWATKELVEHMHGRIEALETIVTENDVLNPFGDSPEDYMDFLQTIIALCEGVLSPDMDNAKMAGLLETARELNTQAQGMLEGVMNMYEDSEEDETDAEGNPEEDENPEENQPADAETSSVTAPPQPPTPGRPRETAVPGDENG